MAISAFGHILLYIIGGCMLIGVVLLLNKILAPHRPYAEKNATYECGEEPVGNANIQFNLRFYVIGLLFLLFDVEILFLFPWATVFADKTFLSHVSLWGSIAFIEMMLFVGILVLGLAYAWVKGDLEWATPKPITPERINPVPDALYDAVNQKWLSANL